MFMSIFKGKARGLGEAPRETVYMKVGVDLRAQLHHFKGAQLAVFMAIALHADENGESFPSYATLEEETGYGSDTIASAQEKLCQLEIDGQRVLTKRRERDATGKYVGGNHYLIFPTPAEVQMWENPDVAKTRGGKTRVEVEPDTKAEPPVKEEGKTDSRANGSAAASAQPIPTTAACTGESEAASQDQPIPVQETLFPSPGPVPTNSQPPKPAKKRSATDTHPGTKPILDTYLALLGYESANIPREAKAAKALALAGYTPEQVTAAYKLMKQETFWQSKHLWLDKIRENIGAMLPAISAIVATGPVAGYRTTERGTFLHV